MIETQRGTIARHGGYHHVAPIGSVRSKAKNTAAIKALRKRTLFSGIYKSNQFTIDAAYSYFAGITFQK